MGQTGHSEDIKNNFRTDPARIESLKGSVYFIKRLLLQMIEVTCVVCKTFR